MLSITPEDILSLANSKSSLIFPLSIGLWFAIVQFSIYLPYINSKNVFNLLIKAIKVFKAIIAVAISAITANAFSKYLGKLANKAWVKLPYSFILALP